MATMTTPDAIEEYVLRSVDPERDAEKLVAMWQASDNQWPGTWSRGVPITAARIREWLKREKRIDALVWDTGDAIAGYCSLWEWPDEANVTYIALLNVAPQYQKLSLARRFLTHYVERVIELGSVRLDLHTWAGNLKAVPLYKKCGFFWLPGTSVHMLNFLPTILTMPSTQPYFKKHDWYKTLKRELTQAEDDERWEGMKVFTYRFEEDGDSLTVWADRESRTITAVETDEFFAAAIAGELEPPGGLPATLRWKFRNKRAEPMQVSLIASGTEELKLDHRTAFEVAPGDSVELEANVQVAAKVPDIRQGKPVPAIKSLFVIDGEVLELGTGLRPRTAIEVSTYPQYVTLLPGVPQTVELQLRSRIKSDVEATLSIAPEPGLQVDWTQQIVPLAAEGYAGFPVTLQANDGGVYELQVAINFDVDGSKVHLPAKPQAIFVLPVGGVLGTQVENKLRIENETIRVVVQREGAEAAISHRPTGEWLTTHVGYAAPPNAPSEYRSGRFDLHLERDGERVVAVASMASRENPDFVLRKRITVTGGPVMTIEHDFDNLGTEERRFQLTQWLGGDREGATLTLPLVAGLGRGAAEEFPGPADDEFRKGTAYAEEWAAVETRRATLGVLWNRDMEEIEWGWGMNSLTRYYDCPPQSRAQPAPLRIYVGDGDWRTVRQLWQRLTGQPIRLHEAVPEPRAPLGARMDPPVAATTGEAVDVTLLVEHLLARKFTGTAQLVLPEGWQADTTELELRDVAWQHPHRTNLHLATNARPGASVARLAIRSPEFDGDFDLPLLRLGDGSAVGVHETDREGQRVLTIDNGHVELDVTPGFAATLSALRAGGADHLASPFPRVATLGWMSPWYGGVMPIVMPGGEWNFPGRLWQETFEAEPVDHRDERGIAWQGVRQRATLTRENLRGLQVEIDTLTVGGSPVVKHVLRVINTTSVARHLETVGFAIFVQPDGSRTRTTLWGPDRQRKHSDRMAFIKTGHWAAAQNPDTERAIALVSPLPEVSMAGMGSEGGHFELLTHWPVPANGMIEVVAFLVVADDIDSARRFEALKDLV